METVMEEEEGCLSQEESVWDEDLDISQLCRICANPNEYLIPIFQGEGLEHELEIKIAKHLPIKVLDIDELPTNLCYQCASTLIAWHDMVVGCLEADEKLRTISRCRTGSNTKMTHQIITNDSVGEDNNQLTSSSSTRINKEQGSKLITSIYSESVIEEEETTSVKPDMIEDESLNTRCVKMEEDMDYYEHDNDDELEDALLSDLESDEDYGTLFNCNICKATNMSLQDFLSHSKLHTKEEKQLALARIVNSKIVMEEAAKSAAATFGFRVQESLESSVTLYQCIVCGQGNLLLKNVREHSSIHPQYIESNFCSICQSQFQNLKSLNSHLEVHLDNNDLICQYCNKRFESMDDLETHEDTHYSTEYMCVECRQTFKSKELVLVHLRKTHSEDNICLICDVEFKSGQVFNNHFMSHAVVCSVKRLIPCFTCDLCGKKYDSKVSLQRHKLFLHNNRIPFICGHCGFFAYHETPLTLHLEKTHCESEDKCICFNCGPASREKCNEDTEVKGEIPAVGNTCKLCGLKFKSRFSLKQHLKSHGEVRNKTSFIKNNQFQQISKPETSFACSDCGEIFKANDFCLTHASYHTESVLCDLCGKAFKDETALNSHLNYVHVSKHYKNYEDINNSMFPFKCKECSSTFKLEFEMEEHCKIHEEVQYQCHFCFKDFTTDCELQDHVICHDDELSELE